MSDEDRQRTQQQNKCLHQWCRDIAEAFDSAGLDMKKVLKPEIAIPWTERSVKDHIWRPIQEIMTGEESTTEPSPQEYSLIAETIVRHMAVSQPKLVLPPWPTKYNCGGRE